MAKKVLDLFKIDGKWMTDADLMIEYGERGYEEAEDYVKLIIEEKDVKTDEDAIRLLKDIVENFESF